MAPSPFQPKTLKDCIRVIATLREEIHKLNVRVREAENKINDQQVQIEIILNGGPGLDHLKRSLERKLKAEHDADMDIPF